MAKLTINGQTVTVDDSFRDLSPEQQQIEVEEIAVALGVSDGGPEAQLPEQDPSYSGSILPFSIDKMGNRSFDSDAGILGALKRSFTLPGEVMAGEIDPNSDDGMRRAMEFATIASPVNSAIRAGGRALPGMSPSKKQQQIVPPSSQQLKEAGSQGFDDLRGLGVDYSSDAVKTAMREHRLKMEADGFDEELSPIAFSILKKLENPPKGSVAPLSGLHVARKKLGMVGQTPNVAEQGAARHIRLGLDRFIERPDQGSVVAGPASLAGKTLKDANANWAAGKRSEAINGIGEAAELRAAAANSGRNIGNATRQRTASLLLSKKHSAGFSKPEIGALEQVVRGTKTANATRHIGNLLGGGGGFGQGMMSAAGAVPGMLMGSPALGVAGAIAAPMGGAASKVWSNYLTKKALEASDAGTRKRSPLNETMQANAPLAVMSPEKRASLIRAMMMGRIQDDSSITLGQ